jgi:SAM-dependent methyltransferase
MAIIGDRLAGLILSRYEWNDLGPPPGYEGIGKLEVLFGSSLLDRIRNKTVLDFGCGQGREAIEMARYGAAEVIGVDIRDELLAAARVNQKASLVQNCTFSRRYETQVDVIVSIDSFEHFDRPDVVLEEMSRLLKPDGFVLFSFGWPWYHPRGGHFPLFPWAHILLTEKSLMKWRSQYKTDGAKRFGEVAGGLNQMSLRKFERLVANSPFKFETFEQVPIRVVRPLHCRLTREFFTAVVRGTLVHRSQERTS